MTVEIIPAIRLPRGLGVFTYNVPKELEQEVCVGQIVQVSFRNKNINGVVIKKYSKIVIDDKKIKFIKKILYTLPLVTKNQIKLIQKISEYYAVSCAIVARSFLPDIPKKNISDNEQGTRRYNNKNKFKKQLFWWLNLDEKNKKYLNIIKKNKNKQILILVPEIEMVDKMIKILKLDNNKNIFINHSHITGKLKYFKNWIDILSGKPKIIIGTKISINLPFANLGAVIIDDSHNWNYKQSDINPRFDARKVAEWIAEQEKCELLLSTPAPSLEEYKQSLFCEGAKEEKKMTSLKIISLKQEHDSGNYSVFSENLLSGIKSTLCAKQQIFLLHNRKGMAGFVECDDCKYVFKCPECDTLLVYYNETKKMHCHVCGVKIDTPPLCPKCAGPNIKFKSKGIEDITAKIKKEFPDKSIISIAKESLVAELKLTEANIIIGTEFALNKIDFSKIGLVGLINFDQLFNIPDFRAQEKAYQKVFEIITKNPMASLIIQTYRADNIILKSLKENNPEIFYASEFEARRELNYPPFSKLIKIIFQDESNSKAFFLSDQLVKKIKDKKLNIEIFGPLPAYPRKIRNKFRYNIIVKTQNTIPSARDKMQTIFDLVPPDFVIDVDPEKIV